MFNKQTSDKRYNLRASPAKKPRVIREVNDGDLKELVERHPELCKEDIIVEQSAGARVEEDISATIAELQSSINEYNRQIAQIQYELEEMDEVEEEVDEPTEVSVEKADVPIEEDTGEVEEEIDDEVDMVDEPSIHNMYSKITSNVPVQLSHSSSTASTSSGDVRINFADNVRTETMLRLSNQSTAGWELN